MSILLIFFTSFYVPANAASWSQATDEVYDLARTSREFLYEYDDVKVESVDFATLDTPAKCNSVCREAIWRNYDLMRPRPQLLFFEYIQENSVYNQQISDARALTVVITKREKVSVFSLFVFELCVTLLKLST